jgi:hypothetical protein
MSTVAAVVVIDDALASLPEPLRAAAPDSDELLALLAEFVEAGGSPGTIVVSELLGLDNACERALVPEQQRGSVEQYDQDAFRFFRDAGVRMITASRSAFAYEHSLARYSKAHEIAVGLDAAAVRANMPLLFLTTSEPGHPLFSEFAPQGMLTILCPHSHERLSGERLTMGGFRSPSDRDLHAPAGWTEVRVGSRLLGWVAPNGHVLRLRIHPFLTANKLTASRLAERVALLVEAVELARPNLRGIGAESGLLAREEHKAAWRASLSQAMEFTQLLLNRTRNARTRVETHSAAAEQARQRIGELTDALCAAVIEADEHQGNVDALTPTLAERATQTISELSRTLAQVAALPQVRRVSVHGEALQVETAPLHVQAGERLVAVDPLTVRLALAPAGRLVELSESAHPAFAPGNSTVAVELGELFIPVAQSVAAGNIVAAVQIVLGLLAAPVAVPQRPDRFSAAENGSRPGFVAAA